MGFFTLTSDQVNQGLTDFNNYMGEIDKLRRRGGNEYLLNNPST